VEIAVSDMEHECALKTALEVSQDTLEAERASAREDDSVDAGVKAVPARRSRLSGISVIR
jgi:hypothetical protein